MCIRHCKLNMYTYIQRIIKQAKCYQLIIPYPSGVIEIRYEYLEIVNFNNLILVYKKKVNINFLISYNRLVQVFTCRAKKGSDKYKRDVEATKGDFFINGKINN